MPTRRACSCTCPPRSGATSRSPATRSAVAAPEQRAGRRSLSCARVVNATRDVDAGAALSPASPAATYPRARRRNVAFADHADAVCQRTDPGAAPRRGAQPAGPRRWPPSTAELPLSGARSGSARTRGRARADLDATPGAPDRVVAHAARRHRRRRRCRRRRRPQRGRRQWGAAPAPDRAARADRRRSMAARAPAARSPRSRSASAPSRGRRPTPTCARRSTSSSTTPAPPSSSGKGRRAAPGPGRAQRAPLRPPGRRRRDLPLELPAGHPLRDDVGGAGHRQRGGAQARRAVPGARLPARAGPARRRRPAGGDLAAAGRGRRRRGAGRPSRRPRRSRSPDRWRSGRQIIASRRPGARRAASLQAGGGRAGRQELRDRRRRRRSRRGRPGDRRLGVSLRRPEVLGRVPGAGRTRRSPIICWSGSPERCRRWSSGRPRRSAPTSRR